MRSTGGGWSCCRWAWRAVAGVRVAQLTIDFNKNCPTQDFEFPAACQRIKVTPDGQYIFASGYHPPQVRPANGQQGSGPTALLPAVVKGGQAHAMPTSRTAHAPPAALPPRCAALM